MRFAELAPKPRRATGWVLVAALWGVPQNVAFAQAARDTEAARAESSEQLLQQGRHAFESKRYAEAHARLSEAYQLHQSYRTACALGQVELELEQYRDAAEHLDLCVTRYPVDDPQQARERLFEGLRETRRHVAVFEPLVDQLGASLLINGVEVGKTPLRADLFVEPGLRRVTVRKPGYRDVSAELFFPAGGTTQWQANLSVEPLSVAGANSNNGSLYLGIGTALTAVTLAGGVALGVIAHAEQQRADRAVEQARQAGPCLPAATSGACVTARRQLDAATRASDAATVTLLAGAGLGVLTVITHWLGGGNEPTDEPKDRGSLGWQPVVYSGGIGAACSGQF